MSASLGSLDGTFADLSRNEARDTIPFYQAEGQILELWDQVQELKLEQALLQAQTTSQSGARTTCWSGNLDLFIPSRRATVYR